MKIFILPHCRLFYSNIFSCKIRKLIRVWIFFKLYEEIWLIKKILRHENTKKKKNPQNNIVLHKNHYNESTEKNLFNLMKLQSTMRGWQIYLKNWFDVTIYIHVTMQICWANSCSELQKVMNFSNERSLFLVQLSIHQSTVKWWKN